MNDEAAILDDAQRAQIQKEVRYALLILEANKKPEAEKRWWERLFELLSNGFVLLIVGTVITSILVPIYQQNYERRKQTQALKQEAFSQFLLYSNSIWREYYAIFPLLQRSEIDRDEYVKYTSEMSVIKLERYDAFARIEGLAVTFRSKGEVGRSHIEDKLEDYAVSINLISGEIDSWLRNLYCSPNKCISAPTARIDPRFDPFDAYLKLQQLMREIQPKTQALSELMIQNTRNMED